MDLQSEAHRDLRVGTSGYDYAEWRGVFYPDSLSRKDYLCFYGGAFSTLELNSTYYRQPRAEPVRAMLDRVGSSVDFAVKANRSLTHDIDPATFGDSVREFRAGLEPLARSGRLCALLLGFPYSFRYGVEERRYLDRLLRELAEYPLVVEYRNAEWYSARVFEGMKERKVGLCVVDVPNLEGLPPVSDFVTSDLAYVRFHGRNSESWWTGDAVSRYAYRYSEAELRGWIPRIAAMAGLAPRMRIFFNNHAAGSAALDAAAFARLLAAAGLVQGA